MAGKVPMPDQEANASRNAALLVLHSIVPATDILGHLPADRRHQWAIVVTDTLRFIDLTLIGWDKVLPTVRKDGANPLKAETKTILVEVSNYEAVRDARRRVRAAGYNGRLIFVANKQLQNQFKRNIRENILFVGIDQRAKTLARLVAG
jgi:hypothetical protein